MPQEVYSICFMCTVRCIIRVEVENDEVKWIEGNPHVPGIEGALCAKGSAGLALLNDTERPQHPMIRPGTDLALNYALIHTILKEGLQDKVYVRRWVKGLKDLQAFIEPYTPKWAAKETGIPAEDIVTLARELGDAKPQVVFHYGYRGAHHPNEIYLRRSIIILNALMGSIETPGGLFFKKGLKAAGRGDIGKYVSQEFPKTTQPRFDGSGGANFPIADASHGNPQMLAHAILKEDPYPIKALIANRFEPLQSIPDSAAVRQALDQLDLIISIEMNFSEFAWYADVILPESTYLERGDSVQAVSGLKPQLFLRKPAVSPRYDTKPAWWIVKELATRLGLGSYFPYESLEDIWDFQLKDTGVQLADFDKKGFVVLSDKALWWDREKGIQFKTPSGKFELVGSLMENAGFPSFAPYTPVPPPEGHFRLMVGRTAVHTHVSTQNNLYLSELVSENELWISTTAAARLGLQNGDPVEVTSPIKSARLKAKVTDFIHPEAVFMLHGFGKTVPAQTRCYQKGASDALLQENISDTAGGSPALDETLVTVRPVK